MTCSQHRLENPRFAYCIDFAVIFLGIVSISFREPCLLVQAESVSPPEMAEDAANTVPETLRIKLLDIERQIGFNTENKDGQPHNLAAVTWAILSAAYSADSEASIDILGSGQRKDVAHIQFHVDGTDTVEDVYNRVQKGLKELNVSGVANILKEANSGLPSVLIATNIDAVVYELTEDATYDLAVTLDSSEWIKNSFHLRACSKSSLAESELDLVLNRCKDLIIQFHGAMHKRVHELDLLIPSDKKTLSALNEHMPPAEYAFIHELIAQQARSTPNNEAICAWDGSLTYEELDKKSTYLANYLVQNGVTVGSWVPLLFEKSKWHIVSMLGVGN